MVSDKIKTHFIKEALEIKEKEILNVALMDLNCSGAGECQPEPVEAEVSDIQPSYQKSKLDKVKGKKD